LKRIITVSGELPAEKMGITMPHEHVLCEINRFSGKIDNLLDDLQTAASEICFFGEAGGNTIVDVTTEDIGRNAEALKNISEITDINIIASAGYYIEETYPSYVLESNVSILAKHMIDEIINGIKETGIRPGIIGELGSTRGCPTSQEKKVLQAAGRASIETGLSITLHSVKAGLAAIQVGILKKTGVSPEKIIAGHMDTDWKMGIEKDLVYYQKLLDEGVYLEFDRIGWNEVLHEDELMERILKLIEKGYAERILLSSDLCRKSFYHISEGRGYDCVLKNFVPKLRSRGVSEKQIRMILSENPSAVFSC
jgi:predicted metal-dependent phosphotriesterase family hydrolase